jgi:hypothetical protein
MTEATSTNTGTVIVETKLTAAQIEENCPVALQNLGKQIAVQYEKALKYEDKANQNYTTVTQLLATAHEACDEGGFNTFRKTFFPNLARSRVYELLAIGTNKKSDKEIKASTRARVAKHRANKAADLQVRYGNGHSEPDALDAFEEHGVIEAPSIASRQMTKPSSRRSVAPGDEAVHWFNTFVLEFNHKIAKHPPERFAATDVPVGVLARLGKVLTDVANLKKSGAAEAAPVVLHGTISDEQAAGDIRADRPVQDAEELRP